jgi:hypothetical protein
MTRHKALSLEQLAEMAPHLFNATPRFAETLSAA